METKMRSYLKLGLSFAALAVPTLFTFSAQGAVPVRDIFAIGRSKTGQACTAKRNSYEPNKLLVFDSATKSYALSCRSATASQTVGWLGIVYNTEVNERFLEDGLTCGAPRTVSLTRIGNATVRLCNDSKLGARTVVLSFVKGGLRYLGSAGIALAGPLEQGLAIASGALAAENADESQINASYAVDELAAPADGLIADARGNNFSADNALKIGIRLNQRGLHADAARTLNDALSRLSSDSSVEERGQLELEAALADSNNGTFKIANKHFALAETLLASTTNSLLQRKLTTYRALHSINQRQFRQALQYLDLLSNDRASTTNPLNDPIQLAILNQPSRQEGESKAQRSLASVAADDTAALQQRVIDAILDWARSASLLALNDVSGAEVRLNDARRAFAVIKGSRIELSQSLWLESRIERQAARLATRKGDLAGAVRAFDRAIAVLRQSSTGGSSANLADLASAQLERADILARQNADRPTVLAAFEDAIKTIGDAGPGAAIDSSAIEGYLDLLAQGTEGSSDAQAAEKFFTAVQSVSEPDIARSTAQLQATLTADPTLAGQLQEYEETGRALSVLSEEIKAKTGAPADERQVLNARRTTLQKRYAELESKLASNSKLEATRDRPADLATIRSKLRAGEVFFKVTPFKRRAYGIAISADQAIIFRSAAGVADIVKRSTVMRNSIASRDASTKIVPAFKPEVAANLYRVLTGPAAALLDGAKSIVVDMTGPLSSIPYGALISDMASVDRYKASSTKSDYSGIGFVIKRSEVSSALSPRSFVVSRNLPASSAKFPLIGFGTPDYPSAERMDAFTPYVTRTGCQADASTVGGSYDRVAPISPDELAIAARELGAENSPLITGRDFSAKSVMERSDLADYAVIHFATHGFREGVWLDCQKSPPALLTSLDDGNHDGLLTFDQIAGLDLSANLVFLAACETAQGLVDEELARATGFESTGGSLEGLIRGFFTAKARAVVATHWEVADRVAISFVERFYQRGRTDTIGASLQSAQNALIADKATSHPFFWATYFLVGDGSKTLLGSSSAASSGGAGN
jgi:CHAT domain-containing protein